MTKIYGIKNCDTIKKTVTWFQTHHIQYEFVDFKITPPSFGLLKTWSEQLGCLNILNKKGTTWKKLSEVQQAKVVDEANAIQLILENPSIVKRPVITISDKIKLVGFDANQLKELFN